ncbi:hypothetical protein [Tropicimonas marinistellae]|uniref:hypothetical protein n=1 Tax=Tropicimonas marinistellae TaxID=1739787 RepID=UPI000829B19B|nr:hypothetical protein [Tropicimonas marinistellae]
MAVIGALRAVLSLDSAAFDKGVKRSQASMNGLQRSLHKTAARVNATGKALSTRVTAPLAAMAAVAVKSSLATVDSQAKLAQSLGTTTKSIQVLSRAGDLAGVSMGQIEQATVAMTKRLSQAAAGSGPAVDALDRLNLSAEGLIAMPVDERIAAIQDALSEFVPEAERAGVASQIFGDRAAVMFSRIDADVLAQATSEVDRFGVAVSDIDADKIEAANDAMSALGLVSRGLANQLTVALAPVLQGFAERLQSAAVWFNGLSEQTQKYVAVAATMAAAIGPAAIALGLIVSALSSLVPLIAAAATGIVGLVGPWGVLAAVVAASAGYFLTFQENITPAEEALRAAQAGTDALNAALGTFYETAAPSAARSAIELANENYKLAQSAIAAAEAEIAKHQAALDAARANTNLRGRNLRSVEVRELNAIEAAAASLAKAEGRLTDAKAQQLRAARAVTSSMRMETAAGQELKNTLDVTIEATDNLGKAASGGGGGGGGAAAGVSELAERLENAGGVMGDFKQTMGSLGESLADVFDGVMDGTIRSWGDALDTMRQAFTSWIKTLVRTALTNPVTLTGQGVFGSTGGTAAALAGGAQSSGLGGLGLLGGLGSFIGTWGGTGVLGGASGLLTNTLANGLSGTTGYISSALSGATSGIAGFGTAVGALALPLAGVGLILGAFQTKVETLQGGLQATVSGLDVTYRAFERTKRSSAYGLSVEESTRYSSAGAKFDVLREAIAATQAEAISTASAIGITEAAFAGINRQIRFDFADKNKTQRLQEVEKKLAGLSNEMAAAALEAAATGRQINRANRLGIEAWQLFARDGETASETLTRLAGDLSAVNGLLDYTGASLLEATARGASFASDLVGRFGSQDALTGAFTGYMELFYSEGERLRLLARDMRGALKPLGEVVPETRQEFRALVDSLDLNTERGRALWSVLIANAGAFDQIYAAAENATAAIRTVSLNAYQGAFLGEGRQRKILGRKLESVLNEFNQSLPETEAGFRQLVSGIDRTTEAGRALHAAIVANVPAFEQYYSTVASTGSALTKLTDTLENRIDRITDKIGDWSSAIGGITEYIRDLRGSGALGATATAAFQNRQYNRALFKALNGNPAAAARLPDLAEARLQTAIEAGSRADYNFLVKRTLNQLSDVRSEGHDEIAQLRELRKDVRAVVRQLEKIGKSGLETERNTRRIARIESAFQANGMPVKGLLEVE